MLRFFAVVVLIPVRVCFYRYTFFGLPLCARVDFLSFDSLTLGQVPDGGTVIVPVEDFLIQSFSKTHCPYTGTAVPICQRKTRSKLTIQNQDKLKVFLSLPSLYPTWAYQYQYGHTRKPCQSLDLRSIPTNPITGTSTAVPVPGTVST